jgi:predicted CXXCH cytochrome family protein
MIGAAIAEDSRILAPPPNALFPEGSAVRLIARLDEGAVVKVDGKAIAVESPHKGVATAELKLGAGAHEVAAGSQSVKFAVGPPREGFKPFVPHPPANTCTSCHTVRNERWRFLRASLANVCSQCHSKETFPAKHTHTMDLLPDCQMCHDPHGSTAAGHMKMDKAKACKQCHS